MAQRPRWEGEVLVPAGQAPLIGPGVGLGRLALSIPLAVWQRWPWWVPPVAAVALACLAFGVATVLLVLNHRRLLWAWEEAMRFDLDGDAVGWAPFARHLIEIARRSIGNRCRGTCRFLRMHL